MENTSSVTTSTGSGTSGLSDGLSDGDADGEADGEAESDGDADGETESDGAGVLGPHAAIDRIITMHKVTLSKNLTVFFMFYKISFHFEKRCFFNFALQFRR